MHYGEEAADARHDDAYRGPYGKAALKAQGEIIERVLPVELQPGDDLASVVLNIIAEAEATMTGLGPTLWAPQPMFDGITVRGTRARLEEIERLLGQYNAPLPNGWLKVRDQGQVFEYFRVIWLKGTTGETRRCVNIDCEKDDARRYAVLYRVADEGYEIPMLEPQTHIECIHCIADDTTGNAIFIQEEV